MATMTKTRPSQVGAYRSRTVTRSSGKFTDSSRRFTDSSRKSAVPPSEQTAETSWFVLLMAVVLALGFLFIGAISYVVLLG